MRLFETIKKKVYSKFVTNLKEDRTFEFYNNYKNNI